MLYYTVLHDFIRYVIFLALSFMSIFHMLKIFYLHLIQFTNPIHQSALITPLPQLEPHRMPSGLSVPSECAFCVNPDI